MRSTNLTKTLNTAVLALAVLLLGASVAVAQQAVNLTAGPTTLTTPDGQIVPMWGYSCGTPVVGSTATCAALNPAAGGNWSPVVITVPTGQVLQINLTNNLSFNNGGTISPANTVPTSIVIVGQIGGGLGDPTQETYVASPTHSAQQNTWPIANTGSVNNPPSQLARVQSMATEVAAGATTSLTWGLAPKQPPLRAGTYLLESGTHPSIQVPMGLVGMLVVSQAPTPAVSGGAAATAGTAYPNVTYDADVPLEFSEIDPVQNNAVNTAVNTSGFNENNVWTRPANSGLTGINVTAGGLGYSSSAPPNVTISGGGGNGGTATATVSAGGSITGIAITSPGIYQTPPFITIDPPPGAGTQATALATVGGVTGGLCTACYPPAVNYTPLYFAINGVPFSRASSGNSVFPNSAGALIATPPATGKATGLLLVRLVNAGLKMHVPSLVGTQTTPAGANTPPTVPGFSIVAEDGNLVPGVQKVQSDVFMAAGKTFDVMINGPVSGAPAIPVYDRELSLSGNSSDRDAGMLAYISVNGSGIPAGTTGLGSAVARNDLYKSLVPCSVAPCTPLVVSDASKGVIANDTNVYGVQIQTAPTKGTLSCGMAGIAANGLCANGTFTYTPNVGTTSDSFSYCANGGMAACATVSLGEATIESASGISMANITYTSNLATAIKIASPGVLSVDSDGAGYPLKVATSSVTTQSGLTLTVDPNGGFKASVNAAGTYQFAYQAQNSQGTYSTGSAGLCSIATPAAGCAVVTLHFPTPNAPTITVKDPVSGQVITDYRWIIEEDKTFYVNPNCTGTISGAPPTGCANYPYTSVGVPATFGTNFHTSHMGYVAQGCFGASTGSLACEYGQTVLNAAGAHVPTVCDVGSGTCDLNNSQETPVNPNQVFLDPGPTSAPYPKRYYISVLPGDAATPFITGNLGGACSAYVPGPGVTPPANCGHSMGGAPIVWNGSSWNPVTVLTEAAPYPTGRLSVQVFEDDFPLNGEQDAGGGIDVIATNEPGLGGFNIVLWDDMGASGDPTGQMTYDMFNQPLGNSLDGTIDPATLLNACPITNAAQGITGMIVTCPKYESDGVTPSPLAGQAVVANMMPGRFSVQAYPGADRIARGEEWLQTNTLDGQHPHDSFIRIGEPSYFQEYGPAGYHVSIGFANPGIINARYAGVCNGTDPNITALNCTNTVSGRVTSERMSRTPDERLYSSGSRDAFSWTQCFVSLGDPDGEDFMFTKCAADGTFTFNGVPQGPWRLSIFDQWNDQLMDGLATAVDVCTKDPGSQCGNVKMGDIPVQQWQANVYTRTFIDDNKDGVYQSSEIGIPLLNTTVRYRDGALANNLLTDFGGVANFNETFPLFNWYVVEADTTRYKTTGIHTVYDSGGPADGTAACGQNSTGNAQCGSSGSSSGPSNASWPFNYLANTYEQNPLPADLTVPGAIYCPTADCAGQSIQNGAGLPAKAAQANSTGRIDPGWVFAEGWQGYSGQNNFIEFAKAPYAANENGGIHGHVVYASTRPFDDPQWNVQNPWEPLVPGVTINLYQEGFAADGITPTLTLVDHTQTSSWDDFAQGFRSTTTGIGTISLTNGGTGYTSTPTVTISGGGGNGATATATITNGVVTSIQITNEGTGYTSAPTVTISNGGGSGAKAVATMAAGGEGVPYMNCPGQSATDLFFYTLLGQWNYLDLYNSFYNGGSLHSLPYNAQYKCYDGMHNWNQLQPAPYDGYYTFPSFTSLNPTTGEPTATNCTICVPDPDQDDKYRYSTGTNGLWDSTKGGIPMLPAGKYVVEVIPPPGYELVKEEDKNILIGDNFIAPVTVEFPNLATAIFIMPDQASVASAYDPTGSGYNPNNAQNPTNNFGTNPVNWIVPGFVEPIWPCVGELRTVPDYMSIFPQSYEVAPFAGTSRHLCDRKEVTLGNQMSATAKFYLYTSTHIASKFTGGITDDFTSEFDPFAPVFGEKFAPPNMPVSTKDWKGNEISRVYSDQWGAFNGLTFSTWEVNPPNPTGYSPTMMVQCMNDKGPINGADDPLYNPLYSQFCYELAYMPGTTDYLDTPVVPTSAFVGAGYNNPDCAYPTNTPAIKSVSSSDIAGPWAASAGGVVTGVNVTNGGSGYTSTPNVTFTDPVGGSGSGATATAVISGPVASLSITNHGSGYSSAPTVSITGGGGSGASATAALGFSVVTPLSVTNVGAGYTSRPTATLTGAPAGGTNAAATNGNTTGVLLSLKSIVRSAGGSGYTTAPTVTVSAPTTCVINGSTCVRATATASISGGAVTGFTVMNPGAGYTARPTVMITGGGGNNAAANNTNTTGTFLEVSTIVLSNSGAGYTTAPAVIITAAPAGGTNATATSALAATGGVYALTLTGGAGYSSDPTITISSPGPGGTLARATATINGSIIAVNLTGGGSGYTAAPTVGFTGGSGSGAAATAVVPPGSTLTITALGTQNVQNYGYSGPSSTNAPFSQKTVARDYNFGSGQGTVTIGGQPATVTSWSTSTITVNVPPNVPNCAVQQQAQYGGSSARCGELVVTAANGQQSIDTVTVTIGGKMPTLVTSTIQAAIDAAAPGDMLIVPPGTYRELVLMWKPVRLQGVGAASSIIDASPHPAGKLDPWRASVNCLFGLALNGQPNLGANVFDSTGTYSCPMGATTSNTISGQFNIGAYGSGIGPDGNQWNYFSGGPNYPQMVVDRIPLEGILGWDATVNGNLAEQLQEPSIMGAYEGAGVTVLSKGVNIPAGSVDVFGSGAEAAFPTGSTLLTGTFNTSGGIFTWQTGDANNLCVPGKKSPTNPFPTNFQCNPSSIDGMGITDSSQGGGGIFVHAWAHNLQIANNRIFNNAGTLSGGIALGQGESPEAYLNGTANDSDPGSCLTPAAGQTTFGGFAANTQLPYCENINVNVHNNAITQNSSTGDELFSGTPAGAGGVSICTGADFYRFNYNWVCGNMSTGDAGGVGHLGFSYDGDIEHNSFLFNQAFNPSIVANGGGLMIMGAAPDATINGVECGSVTDNDCVPGLGDGTGPGLVINANLIQGNSADAGSGGGLRFQGVNGTDVARFPNQPQNWYAVQVTNNIINNNVAGWDGAGVSFEDALAVTMTNNTIASNDSTASAGVLFNTLGAPLASSQSPAPVCQSQNGGSASCPQPAGIVVMQNSPQLFSSFTTGRITCPAGNYAPGTPANGGSGKAGGSCAYVSYPALYNNIIWQNRSFQIGVGSLGGGQQNQQNVVTLYNAAFNGTIGAQASSQASTGACPSGSSYWDIGVRNDKGPGDHTSGYTLNPLNGVLTSNAGYSGTNVGNQTFGAQYCNGSRVPPENGGLGYQVPPGIADAVMPNPVFSLTPAATVDEGNNWINISWGPLSMLNPVTSTETSNAVLGNYAPTSNLGSISCNAVNGKGQCVENFAGAGGISGVKSITAPTTDFFGHPRPDTGSVIDPGAVEVTGH
jgi:hypothetical protein